MKNADCPVRYVTNSQRVPTEQLIPSRGPHVFTERVDDPGSATNNGMFIPGFMDSFLAVYIGTSMINPFSR